ncbi:MAG: hypothetical protein KAJ20_03425 [Candidatus Aenigmarchaeota archaeon]|nr:hypothetical protein [Candidatus Aenigmarchaeota archaeon]MCK5373362.1 hypothetical protein [Candidatus Aenigmarchaeota archaeon]
MDVYYSGKNINVCGVVEKGNMAEDVIKILPFFSLFFFGFNIPELCSLGMC